MKRKAQGDLIKKIDLLVIGSGPSGISALLEAKRRGISALAVESGHVPLYSIWNWLNGLPIISGPTHFEVGGLPLDCRDPKWVTREELLHYYMRVINGYGLRIETDTRCTSIDPKGGREVEVKVEDLRRKGARRTIRAKKVIVTNWYRKREPKNPTKGQSHVRVYSGTTDPAELSGSRVVIIGGGLSSFEQAGALMMNGQAVTIMARGRFFSFQRYFRNLLKSTGSRIIEDARDIRVERDGISCIESRQRKLVACDAVVYCIGSEIDPEMLGVLRKAKVLSPEDAECLAEDKSVESFKRSRELKGSDVIREWNKHRPNLWKHLFEGVSNIHLAGGALHWGSYKLATCTSILTARLATAATQGEVGIPKSNVHLSDALLGMIESGWLESLNQLSYADVRDLRPLAIRNWSRSICAVNIRETASENTRIETGLSASYFILNAEGPEKALYSRIVELSDGTLSVEGIARKLELSAEGRRTKFLQVLRQLWWSNALTWLPPRARWSKDG